MVTSACNATSNKQHCLNQGRQGAALLASAFLALPANLLGLVDFKNKKSNHGFTQRGTTMNSKTNRSLLALSAAVALLTTSALTLAAVPPTLGGGVFGTKHDFSGTGYQRPVGGVTVGSCSICHTPHVALSTRLLWNQQPSTVTSYTWGDTTITRGGTVLPSTAGNGPSVRCLSCHDGSVAVGDTAVFHETVRGMGAPGDGTLGFNTGTIVGRVSGIFQIGTAAPNATSGSMAGNHPIGIPYPLNNVTGNYNGVSGGTQVDYVEFVANPHAPATGIKLYTDDGAGNITAGTSAGQTGIECTSCHDPHNKQVQDWPFLRGKVQGSTKTDGYLCLQCHVK